MSTSGRWPLLLNGELNWQFLGMLRSLSPSILSIECVKETFVVADSSVIFYNIVTAGVIIPKPSSSSVNSRSSSESSLEISSTLSIISVCPYVGVHIDAYWLVVFCVCVCNYIR
jgi:hypothetical protein